MKKLAKQLAEALKAAGDHLEYCGYGDSWERECADAEGLPEKIQEALKAAHDAGLIEPTRRSRRRRATRPTREDDRWHPL